MLLPWEVKQQKIQLFISATKEDVDKKDNENKIKAKQSKVN